MDKLAKLYGFLCDGIVYFDAKMAGVDRDRYFADRDIRSILDKTINDLILCLADMAEECLRLNCRSVPDTYRDTILACYEFVGDSALEVAPLVKRRNELVHQYVRVNWQNIVAVRDAIPKVRLFAEKIMTVQSGGTAGDRQVM